MRFLTPLRFGFLVTVITYILLNSIVFFKDYQNKKELSSIDLNQDGLFSNSEISPRQKEAMDKVSNDTAGNLAPLTLIPLTVLLGCIVYKLKKKADK